MKICLGILGAIPGESCVYRRLHSDRLMTGSR